MRVFRFSLRLPERRNRIDFENVRSGEEFGELSHIADVRLNSKTAQEDLNVNRRNPLITLLVVALPIGLAAQTANWTQQSPSTSPSGRGTPAMAYDSKHSQVVLFSGFTANGIQNDTWNWDGSNWTMLNPAQSPPPRSNSAMAYDSTHGQTMVFRGEGASSSTLGDPLGNPRDVWTGTKSRYWTNGTGVVINSDDPPGGGWQQMQVRK